MKMEPSTIDYSIADNEVDTIQQLSCIWDRIGIFGTKRDERIAVVKQHVKSLLTDMISEEENLETRLKDSVDKCKKEHEQLSQALSLTLSPMETNLTLLVLESKLRNEVNKLWSEKDRRLKSEVQLRDRENELCRLLGVPQLVFADEKEIPSADDLNELEQQILMLSEEKVSRQDKFHSIRMSIMKLIKDIEYSPGMQFECDLVCEDETSFILSTKNMNEAKLFLDKLLSRQSDYKRETDELRDRLKTLWDRLNVDQAECDEFLTLCDGYKPSIIHSLTKEVARYEELKKQNIQQFIEKTRRELISWWDKCFISQQQRNKFTYLNDDDYTEKLLSIHECEVGRMKQYFNTNQELIMKVHKRQELWSKMIEFERIGNDPKRFNNRGGGLLQEEHERKKLLKRLPKLEKELELLVSEWEVKEGKQFLVHGMRFLDFVESQWKEYRQEKENEKIERRRVKAKQLEDELVRGIKSQKSTPLAVKRLASNLTSSKTPTKRIRTERTPMSSQHIVAGNSIFSSPLKRAKSKTPLSRYQNNPSCNSKSNTPVSSMGVRILTDRNVNVDESAFSQTAVSKPGDVNSTFASTVASYTDFTEDMNQKTREFCRSSMASPALRSTSKKREQTPIRTTRRLTVRKTPLRLPRTPKYMKSPATPLRGTLGLPFLI